MWLAFGIIFIAIFLTQINSVIEVAGIVELKETNTSLWNLFYNNLLTSNPTDNLVNDLAAFGLDSAAANALIEKHNLGNSLVTGLFGLLPILLVFTGVLLVSFKQNLKEWVLYPIFTLIATAAILVHTNAPATLGKIEILFNEVMAGVMPLGTMMVEGTKLSFGFGFYVIIVGTLYGVVSIALNQFGIIKK